MTSTVDINEINSFLMDFAEAINQTNSSIFPLDLITVNNIMEKFFMYVYWSTVYHYNVATFNGATCVHPCSATERNSTTLKLDGINITEVLLS